MRTVFLFALTLATTAAQAGPAAALFCQEKRTDEKHVQTFSAFDIALKPGSGILRLDGKNLGAQKGEVAFELNPKTADPIKAKLLDFSLEEATVEYRDKNGELLDIVLVNDEEKSIGKLTKVAYGNPSKDNGATGRRKGTVTLFLESPESKIAIDNCLYEGGTQSDWKKTFGK